jgi:LPS O-antigen subunit length determinant protein (WzzB/FepE family)
MSDQNLNPNFNSNIEDEISLKDIVDFLVESWKAIILTGLLGLLGSIAYLWVTPSQYQAIAQIKMAQIISNNNANPLNVNVEEPNFLIARFKLPSTYSVQEIKACGFESSATPFEALAAVAKFSTVNGAGSIIELKILRDNKESAIACVQSIFEKIKVSQNKIIEPYINESKALLIHYEARLANSQLFVTRSHKSGSDLSAAYLANRDEVKFLAEEIFRLNTFIKFADTRHAYLVSPIYASDTPVFPKKKESLMVGLLVGILLGLLFVMGKKAFKAYKVT